MFFLTPGVFQRHSPRLLGDRGVYILLSFARKVTDYLELLLPLDNLPKNRCFFGMGGGQNQWLG